MAKMMQSLDQIAQEEFMQELMENRLLRLRVALRAGQMTDWAEVGPATFRSAGVLIDRLLAEARDGGHMPLVRFLLEEKRRWFDFQLKLVK